MKERLRLLCEAFIQAKHKIGRTFTDSDEIDALCANILITRGLAADKDALLRCRSILCTRAALFSALCGVMGSPVSCLMYAADDPVKLFTKLVDVHTVLKRYFADSPYLVYASAVLTEFPDEMNEGIAIRARNIYELMKLTHPGITSSEDQVFCVLFAASGRDADTLLYETEYIQKTLDTGASNTWQSVAHILTIADGQPDTKCRQFREIYNGLADMDLTYSPYGSFLMLAALTAVCRSTKDAVNDVSDAYWYLRSREKDTNILKLLFDDHERQLIYATLITAVCYTPEDTALPGSLAVTAAEYALLYINDIWRKLGV